jgi:hypothetical protein
MTTTLTTRKSHEVTPDQLDACMRVIDGQTNEVFYRVASQTDFEKTYTVRAVKGADGKHYLTCTCPAGSPPVNANGSLQWSPRPCWHKRAASAHADEYKALEQARAEREARREADAARLARIRRLVERGLTHEQALMAADNHESITDDELVRVYGKPAKKVTGKGRTDLRTFSLMR